MTNVHYVPGNAITLESTYDAFDNRTDLDVTDDAVVYAHEWAFDELDRLYEMTAPGSGTTLPGSPLSLAFEYFDNDDLRELTHGNDAKTTYTYYANGPVDTITVEDASSTQLHRLDYTVDERLKSRPWPRTSAPPRSAPTGPTPTTASRASPPPRPTRACRASRASP